MCPVLYEQLIISARIPLGCNTVYCMMVAGGAVGELISQTYFMY